MIIAVTAHDAGASELLCAYIKAHPKGVHWKLFAKNNSPFFSIASRENLHVDSLDALDFCTIDALFIGTGWQVDETINTIHKAKQHIIPTFAFLDHWSNYKKRFGYPDKMWRENLSDFMMVSDDRAFNLAKKLHFDKVIQIKNYYLAAQLDNLPLVENSEQLLFLSEPTQEVALKHYGNKHYWGFTQYSALENILDCFDFFTCSSLSIRLHPSETKHHYYSVLKKYPYIKYEIHDASFIPLQNDLLRAKFIVGLDTMALYSAALMHKPLISYLPSQNRDFLLPLPSSHQLRKLDNLTPLHLEPLRMQLSHKETPFEAIVQYIKDFR